MNDFCQRSGVPLRLEHFSSWFWPHFADDIKYGGLLFLHMREKGVHLWDNRPCFFSTAHTDADIAFIVEAFKSSIGELQAGGFLPGESVMNVGTNGHNGQNGHSNGASAPLESSVILSGASPRVQSKDLPAGGSQTSIASSRAMLVGTMPPAAEAFSTPLHSARDDKHEAAVGMKPLQFSLYFFGNYPAAYDPDKYRLILDGARFADQNNFTAVWLPERHFHALGGFSPNPSLLAAALARETSRIALRGGSVVLPLHHPVRVAEEWAMVDNLSNGRVGMSIASGWHPNDFVFAPDRFERRREICLEDIQTIQKLWRATCDAAARAGPSILPILPQADAKMTIKVADTKIGFIPAPDTTRDFKPPAALRAHLRAADLNRIAFYVSEQPTSFFDGVAGSSSVHASRIGRDTKGRRRDRSVHSIYFCFRRRRQGRQGREHPARVTQRLAYGRWHRCFQCRSRTGTAERLLL